MSRSFLPSIVLELLRGAKQSERRAAACPGGCSGAGARLHMGAAYGCRRGHTLSNPDSHRASAADRQGRSVAAVRRPFDAPAQPLLIFHGDRSDRSGGGRSAADPRYGATSGHYTPSTASSAPPAGGDTSSPDITALPSRAAVLGGGSSERGHAVSPSCRSGFCLLSLLDVTQ